jgi:hypothetical protein
MMVIRKSFRIFDPPKRVSQKAADLIRPTLLPAKFITTGPTKSNQ